MSIEDACKVISYLTEKIEDENDLTPACENSVALTSNILSDYGFEMIKTSNSGHFHTTSHIPLTIVDIAPFLACKRFNGVLDLFTIGGDPQIFKKTKLYDRYFNWFTEGVTKQDIENIYEKLKTTHLLPKPTKQEQNV